MSSRKLQQEFDKLQKKVTEGLQQFDEIHDKIAATDNPSLKDKLEGDLRKEIKKLQRSRDQVKQWSGDSSNKLDRAALQESRSRIENAMERFKEVEKISKLKQFSNEGLEMQTKLGARGLDEAKKIEASRYITEALEDLNHQSELLVAESAQLSHKKKSPATQAVMDDLAMKIERNNGHVAKLELILRNLDNDQLAPERIDDIKDDLDYYLENNQSPDFVEYDDFYDTLELDESLEVVTFPEEHPIDGPKKEKTEKTERIEKTEKNDKVEKPEKSEGNDRNDKSEKGEKNEKGEKSEKSGKTEKNEKSDKTEKSEKSDKTEKSEKGDKEGRKMASLNATPPPPNSWTSSSLHASRGHSAPSGTNSASGPGVVPATAPSRAPPPGLNPHSKPGTPATQGTPTTPVSQGPNTGLRTGKPTAAEELKKKAIAQASNDLDKSQNQSQNQNQNQAPNNTSQTQSVPHTSEAHPTSPSVKLLGKNQSSSSLRNPSSVSPDLGPERKGPPTGAAALAHSRLNNPLPFSEIAQQLEASLLNCPDSFDSEKPRQYNPTNVHPSSVDYPQEPMYELNSMAIMRKFDTDTLFFCFYYNEGVDNLAKYNAVKELSRRGWVFNVDTKQWFSKEEKVKRHSVFNLENNADDAEKGSYKYFDYESSWLVRRKDNFEFKSELKRTF